MANFYRYLCRRPLLLGLVLAFCSLSGCSGCSSSASNPAPVTTSNTTTDATSSEDSNPPAPIPLNLLPETYGPGAGRPPRTQGDKLVRVSFLTPVEGRNKLFSIDLTGNPETWQVLVTDPDLGIVEHAWDGAGHAVFVADRHLPNKSKVRGVFVYDSLSGTVRELTEGLVYCPYDESDIPFSFQIAGGVVAFMAARAEGDDPCATNRNFFTAAANGQNLREISNGLVEMPGPAPLSPDGTTIGFAASDGHDIELYVADVATQVQTQLTRNSFDEIEYPVACTGGRWAFPAFDGTNFEVYLFTPGEAIRALTSGETNFFNLYWNPNCTKLAFQGIETSTSMSEIYIYTIHGPADGTLARVTQNGQDEDLISDPWNPAFDILDFSLPAGEIRQLGMTHLDQSPEQWTAHEASLGQAVWAPGGDKILYSTVDGLGNTQIWVRNIAKALHFPLGPARANGIALNFACGNPNFAILRDSDGHDGDIWVVDLESGSRLNVTMNAMEDFDPQCALLPGEAISQPMPVAVQSGSRNLCDLVTCDTGATCLPETGACASNDPAITNCNFPSVDCPTNTHCSLATEGETEGTCIPDGYCDENEAEGRNECEGADQTCVNHVCEGPPPPNHTPKVTILNTSDRFGVRTGTAPTFTVEEGVEMTVYFKVEDPDAADALALRAEVRDGAVPECGDRMSGCLSQVPADPPAGTPEGANWKFVWRISHGQVDEPRGIKMASINFIARDNHQPDPADSVPDDSVLLTFTINDKDPPPPVVISVTYGETTILESNAETPIDLTATGQLIFDVTATSGGRPTPIEVTSPGGFVQVTDQTIGDNDQAKRLVVSAPCGLPGIYMIPIASQDPATGALNVVNLHFNFQRENRMPTTRLIYPNPDFSVSFSKQHFIPRGLIRSPGPAAVYLVATSHDPEDTLAVSETIATYNPTRSTTKMPPDLVVSDATLDDYPAFDEATCTFNKVRKVEWTADTRGPGKVEIAFRTTDGAPGHTVTSTATAELGHIWVAATETGGLLHSERDYVVADAGKILKLNLLAAILDKAGLLIETKKFSFGTVSKVAGGYQYVYDVPPAANWGAGWNGCTVVPVILQTSSEDVIIQRAVRLIVKDGSTTAVQLERCIAGRP